MSRGPAPKPTRLKVLAGNPSKRPLNQHEPQPTVGVPDCPTWLDTEAKKKWKELVPELERLGLLTVVDGAALACYCQAWAEFRQATMALKKDGRYIQCGTQQQPHPAVAQQRTAWKAIREFSSLFGLDPSARSRLVAPGQSCDDDPAEAFFRKA